MVAQPLTKRQRKLAQKAELKVINMRSHNLDLDNVSPMTENQELVFKFYEENYNLFLKGCAGTGKTYISLYLAFNEILNTRSPYKRIVIIRNAQASKNIGFLPGNEKQKMEVFKAPYKKHCAELFNRGDAYDILEHHGLIQFESTSFLRGTTIDDAIIILDEAQNLVYQELRTVLTRAGGNSRVIICGDTKQDDITSERYRELSGLTDIIRVLDSMPSVKTIEFEIEDIVRSGFVREFLEAEYKLNLY